jgi:hypothetical protein
MDERIDAAQAVELSQALNNLPLTICGPAP